MATETTTSNKPNTSAGLSTVTVKEPIIIDLGKKKRKQVRKLSKGKACQLADRIQEVLEEAILAKAVPSDAQPVLVIVREKKKRARGAKMFGLG